MLPKMCREVIKKTNVCGGGGGEREVKMRILTCYYILFPLFLGVSCNARSLEGKLKKKQKQKQTSSSPAKTTDKVFARYRNWHNQRMFQSVDITDKSRYCNHTGTEVSPRKSVQASRRAVAENFDSVLLYVHRDH